MMAETDLISRQAAIRRYCGEHCGCEPQDCGLTMLQDGSEDCDFVRFLKEEPSRDIAPSAQPEPRWIPCSERLPEEGVNVLLCIKDWESQKTKMVVSLRRDYNYWDGLGRDIRGDIAWMPLPEPYKAESEG